MARPDGMAKKKSNDSGLKKDQVSQGCPGLENEGEGNKTAARRYNDATQKYVESGKVGPAAEKAEEALDDGAQVAELELAEEEGKLPAADRPARDKRPEPRPRMPSPG